MTSVLLFLQATNSPILSPMLNVRTQFEHYVNDILLTDWIARSRKSTPSPVLKPPPSDISSVSFSPDDAIISLLESSELQAERHCSLLEQFSQLCSQVLELKAALATCEAENIRLDDRLQAAQAASSAYAMDSGATATSIPSSCDAAIPPLPTTPSLDTAPAVITTSADATDSGASGATATSTPPTAGMYDDGGDDGDSYCYDDYYDG